MNRKEEEKPTCSMSHSVPSGTDRFHKCINSYQYPDRDYLGNLSCLWSSFLQCELLIKKKLLMDPMV